MGPAGAAAGREENEPHEDNQPMSKMSNCYLDDSNDQWRLPNSYKDLNNRICISNEFLSNAVIATSSSFIHCLEINTTPIEIDT